MVITESKCSRFNRKSGMIAFAPFPNARRRYFLKTKPNIQLRQEIATANQVRDFEATYLRRIVRRFAIYQTKNVGPLSNTLKFYSLNTKSNIQQRQNVMEENQLIDSNENYWRKDVRRATTTPAYKLRYRYRTRYVSTPLKTDPTSNYASEVGVGINHLR